MKTAVTMIATIFRQGAKENHPAMLFNSSFITFIDLYIKIKKE